MEDTHLNREKLLFQYTGALERGDMDTIIRVLEQATNDPVLGDMLLEVNGAYDDLQTTPTPALTTPPARYIPPSTKEQHLADVYRRPRWQGMTLAVASLVTLLFVFTLLMSTFQPGYRATAARPAITAQNAAALMPIERTGMGAVTAAVWSPAGATLAVGTEAGVYLYPAGVFDMTVSPLFTQSVEALAYSSDGARLYGLVAGDVVTWDTNGTRQNVITGDYDTHLLVLPNEQSLVTATCTAWYQTTTCASWQLHRLNLNTGDPNTLQMKVTQPPALSPDGQWLATASALSGEVTLWRTTGDFTRPERTLTASGETPFLMHSRPTFSPDGSHLGIMALADDAARIIVWDVTTAELVQSVRVEHPSSVQVFFDMENRPVYSEVIADRHGGEATLRTHIITPETRVIDGTRGTTTTILQAARAGDLLVTYDDHLHTWRIDDDWRSSAAIATLQTALNDVHKLAFAPDAPYLAIGSAARIGVWNYETDEPLFTTMFNPQTGLIAGERIDGGFAFAPDNTFAYSDAAPVESGFGFWTPDGVTTEPLGTLTTADATAISYTAEGGLVAYFANGSFIARKAPDATTYDRTVIDLPFPLLDSISDYDQALNAVFATNGGVLAVDACLTADPERGCTERRIALVDTISGDVLVLIESGFKGAGDGLALNVNGDRVLLAASGCTTTTCSETRIKLWDVSGWMQGVTASPTGLLTAEGAGAVAFSPDGRLLANTHNGTLRLMDLDTLRLVYNDVLGTSDAGLTFSPDGRLLAVGSVGRAVLYGVTIE